MPQYSKNPIESAYSLYGSGAMQDVQALCQEILRHQPKNFEAIYLSGLALCRMGDTKTGRRLIKRSCRIHPRIKAFTQMESVLRHQGVDDITILESRIVQHKIFSTADVFALSYPKCGRTWARLMLGTYALNGNDGDPLEVYRITNNDPDLSTLFFSHDDNPHWKPFATINADKTIYKGKKVVFFIRDPRDVLVSYFFQYTLRGDHKIANDPDFDGSLSDFIRHPIGGLKSIVRFYNIWASKREVPDGFLLLRYEDMHAEPVATCKDLIGFLNWPDHGQGALEAAVSFGDFDNMKKLEQNNTLNNVKLKPPVDGNPEGFKVRRGKVGGYVDYFSEDDTGFVNDYLERELDDFYFAYKLTT